MTRKIVRWLGKILSPSPNTVTSDLSCCCGCLCCGLTTLTFEIESISTPGGPTLWYYNVIEDPDCEFINEGNPYSPGSAYSLFVTDTGGELNFYISLYCINTQNLVSTLIPNNPGDFSVVGGKPSGSGSFAPLEVPNSEEYDCRISIIFSGDTATVKFTQVPV